MQIEVDDVNPHVAWPRHTDERIHVGAVHVNQPASLVHNPANLLDVCLKEPERVWICQHQPGNVAPFTKLA
jgi:hypothetical protein